MGETTGNSKRNCWEIMSCGRGPESATQPSCNAALNLSAHGVNNGINGGRVCWAIAGTMCAGKVQGAFALKLGNCMNCTVMKTVKQEEGDCFLLLPIESSSNSK